MQTKATVVVENTTRQFDKEYTYIVPENLKNKINKGTKVEVPFGSGDKLREAIVMNVSCEEISTLHNEESYKLKSISSILEEQAVYPVQLLEMASWMKNRYICTLWDALRCIMLPANVAKSKAKTIKSIRLAITEEEANLLLQTGELKSIHQIRTLEALLEHESIEVSDMVFLSGASKNILNNMEKKGIVQFFNIETQRIPLKGIAPEPDIPKRPTRQQAEALEKLKEFLLKDTFQEVLLHGITGSGKTEVYLQLMSMCMEIGKTAIMLVPEIALTPQMIQRLRSRFGENVAVLHSRLSIGERYDQWNLIKSGNIKVVIGARSAVFAPLTNIGMIVVDEEHETSYKSEKNPKYHAMEIALWRCHNEKALLLKGSATPSIESYQRALTGKSELIKMNERANKLNLPKVQMVDMKNELELGNRSVISKRLEDEIRKNIEDKKQTILFLNRRGFATFILCRSCSYVPICRNCNITMTYHLGENRLVCHYCGYTEQIPVTCPVCKSADIRHFGAGTQRIEDDIRKKIPGCSVIRMDSDTTGLKNSFEELLKKFREEKTDIIIGTQMIAKGHDFPEVTLVGIVAADSMLHSNDFRASERTFQLLTQVAGRAGRGEVSGRVIIQAYSTDDYSINLASRHDYESFFANELLLRKKQNYPPFTNIGVIFLSGKFEKSVKQKAEEVYKKIQKAGFGNNENEEVFYPTKAPLSKIREKFRYRIVVKCRQMKKLIKLFTEISDGVYGSKNRNGIELGVDINPYNML